MLEYLSLGHMEKVEEFIEHQDCYILPHHGVLSQKVQRTKLVVVFNVSLS